MNAITGLRELAALSLIFTACAPRSQALELRQVVLYQNGIGYFEHSGRAQESKLELSFRRHELGDVLKTLTIVEAGTAAAAAAAVTMMAPQDDATRAALSIALRGSAREVLIAYAVPTPTWKASYRLVLPDPGKDKALLQGWAAIHNSSEEDWNEVKLTLATGAPLSFAIDLLTPQYVARPDLTGKLVEPVALGAISSERALPGDSDSDRIKDADDLCPKDAEDVDRFEDEDGCPDADNDRDRVADAEDQCPNEPETYNGISDDDGCPDRGRVVVTDTSVEILDKIYFKRNQTDIRPESLPIVEAIAATLMGNPDILEVEVQGHAAADETDPWNLSRHRAANVQRALVERGVATRLVIKPFGTTLPLRSGKDEASQDVNRRIEFLISRRADGDEDEAPAGNVTAARLERSVSPQVTPRDVAGMVRYELGAPVTIARGASALVPMLNKSITGEDVYLFRPDGNAPGSATYPWRAARLQNETGLPLEPGPVAIFARGAFVGDGLIERMHEGDSAFIPYALDSSTVVRVDTSEAEEPVELASIARGVVTVENRRIRTTRYEVKASAQSPRRIFLRHTSAAGYEVYDLPPQAEEAVSGHLVPMPLAPSRTSVLAVKERQAVRRTLRILDMSAHDVSTYLSGSHVPKEIAARLDTVLTLRTTVTTLEDETEALRERLVEVGERADEIRESLKTIGQVRRAAELRARLLASLTEATTDTDRLSRELAGKSAAQAEARARLLEAVRELAYEAPRRAP